MDDMQEQARIAKINADIQAQGYMTPKDRSTRKGDNMADDVSSRISHIADENSKRKERMTARREGLEIKSKVDDVQEERQQEKNEQPAPQAPEEQPPQTRADTLLLGYNRDDINYAMSPFGFRADVERMFEKINEDVAKLQNNPQVEDEVPEPSYPYFEGGDTFPWEKCSFGYKISGNKITVYTGSFIWGQKKFTATQQVFTIITSKAYIQLKLNWANAISDSGTIASIVNSGSTEQLPDDSDYYKTLYEVSLDGAGTAIDKSQTKIRHFLDFVIPGYMSPGV